MSSGVETRTIPAGDGRELCMEIAGDPAPSGGGGDPRKRNIARAAIGWQWA